MEIYSDEEIPITLRDVLDLDSKLESDSDEDEAKGGEIG
jgi:hypothetical protein